MLKSTAKQPDIPESVVRAIPYFTRNNHLFRGYELVYPI